MLLSEDLPKAIKIANWIAYRLVGTALVLEVAILSPSLGLVERYDEEAIGWWRGKSKKGSRREARFHTEALVLPSSVSTLKYNSFSRGKNGGMKEEPSLQRRTRQLTSVGA